MNVKDIRLIVMDIDGTLVNSQRQLTPKTKEALIRLEEHGICGSMENRVGLSINQADR